MHGSFSLGGQPAGRGSGARDTARRIVEAPRFNAAVTFVIVVNAIGLETWPAAMQAAGPLLLDLNGTIGASMYTLFQVMTLESWSMGIVRPVMEQYPYAWAFFMPFIVVTSFAVLNLFIALSVNSMQTAATGDREAAEAEAEAEARLAHDERESLALEIIALREELRGLRDELRTGR